MPRQIYTVEIDGTQYDIEGDRPPTEAEARSAISAEPSQRGPVPASEQPSLPTYADDVKGFLGSELKGAGNALLAIPKMALQAVTAPKGLVTDTIEGIRGLPTMAAQYIAPLVSSDAGDSMTRAGLPPPSQDAYGQLTGGAMASATLPKLPQAAANGVRRGSLRLMQSALKPSASLVKSRAGAGVRSASDVAQAVLDEGRIVTQGSLSKAQTALDATDDAAQAAIQAGAGRGVTVDSAKVADAIGGTRQQFGAQINAQPDVAAVNAVRRNFVNNPRVSDPVGGLAPLPADVAHQFASNTGKNLKGKFGRLGGATVEAEKAGRANIAEQLRQGIPELEPLWQREAAQITTRDALEQALARRANTDPIGLTGMVGMLKSPAAMATAAADRSAAAKSFLAQAMKRGAGPLDAMPEALRSALLARLLQDAQNPQAR